MTIAYPVRAVGGLSHQLEDAAGRVIGSVEAAALINHGHEHGHAGELGERQVNLIRRLQERVEALERWTHHHGFAR